MNAPFLHLMSYLGSVLGFCFMTLSLASGLYYLAEFVEEYTALSKKIIRWTLWVGRNQKELVLSCVDRRFISCGIFVGRADRYGPPNSALARGRTSVVARPLFPREPFILFPAPEKFPSHKLAEFRVYRELRWVTIPVRGETQG